MCLSTMFVDMDAYFATVEQQLNPALRHKPVAVVPMITDNTCCIAASYEAKRCGIKTGTAVGEAKEICPDLQIVLARPDVYVRFHHVIVEAVESCVHVSEIHSVDEMSCRLMGDEKKPQRALAIAQKIKHTLQNDVGDYMRCSIGAGPNRMLAKVASNMEKPNGLVIITPDDLPEKLHPLELTDFPGIAKGMEKRLHRHGVHTVQQLCALSQPQMQSVWQSVLGLYWWHWLRGHDVSDIPTHRRTVGHSHVLPPKERTRDGARAVMIRLIHRAAARMRNLRYWAKQMMVFVSYSPHGKWKSRVHLGLCQDTLTIVEAFARLWESSPQGKPMQVGMVLFDLVADHNATLPLFSGDRNRIQLAHTMDRLNARFGMHTVYLGGMHDARRSAPMRISFTNIPHLDPTEM